jgi:iron complex outermembrane receptor protein
VVWAEKGIPAIRKYYDLDAVKSDYTIYAKEQRKLATRWYIFYDLQFRIVDYDINGFRANPGIVISRNFSFFNPKAGLSYSYKGLKTYLSIAVANKEPNRDDFEAGNLQQPKRERLTDVELGIENSGANCNWAVTFYDMNYKDQLVLTGKINDVGAYSRINIPKSYRRGVELQGGMKFNKWLNVSANLAISSNRIKDFTEYLDDYDNGGQKSIQYSSTSIAYSPAVVGAAVINFLPLKNLEISFLNKYVSRQYLDNTENESRSLDPFFTTDLRIIKNFRVKKIKELNLTAQVFNFFNTKYEPNGYTFSYIYGGATTTENYYFPMAGRNFLIGLNLRL